MATAVRTASLLSREADRARSERQMDFLCFFLHQGLAQLSLLTLQPIQSPPLTRTASQLLSMMLIPNSIQLSTNERIETVPLKSRSFKGPETQKQ